MSEKSTFNTYLELRIISANPNDNDRILIKCGHETTWHSAFNWLVDNLPTTLKEKSPLLKDVITNRFKIGLNKTNRISDSISGRNEESYQFTLGVCADGTKVLCKVCKE